MNRVFTHYDLDGNKINIMDLLKDLKMGKALNKKVLISITGKRKILLRVCELNFLKLYGMRWQEEILFKQPKSIYCIKHLPKFDTYLAKTWLRG